MKIVETPQVKAHMRLVKETHMERLSYRMKDPLEIMIWLETYGLLKY